MLRSRWVAPLLATLLLALALVGNARVTTSFVTPPDMAQSMGTVARWQSGAANAQGVAPASASTPVTTPAEQQIKLKTENGAYTAAQLRALEVPLADALRYVQERTSMQLKAPVTVLFSNERGCKLSGVAYTQERRIKLFVCPDTELDRAVSIMAHEFVHQLAADHYGEAHFKADLILSEGVAQWGAGAYKLKGHPDFRTLVRKTYGNDLLPLATESRGTGSFGLMRHLYDQWAAYVEWIVATQGRAALDELYASGTERAPGSAGYKRVLGMPLDTGEQQWKAWLTQ